MRLFVYLFVLIFSCFSAQAFEKPCWLCYGEIDYLYWQANMGDIAIASAPMTTLNFSSTDPSVLKYIESKSDLTDPGAIDHYSSGVRAAIGFRSICNPWNFKLRGTYFQTNNEVSSAPDLIFSETQLQYLIPNLNVPFMGNGASSAVGSWKVDFLTVDLLASRSFSFCNMACFNPFFGLRGAWIRQKLKADYFGVFFTTPGNTLLEPHTGSIENSKYLAIGFISGFDFSVPLYRRLNLIGSMSGSLLYGHVNANDIIQGFHAETNPNPPPDFILGAFAGNFSTKKTTVRANFETELGLAYRFLSQWELYATYELSLWWDQNDFIDFIFSAPVLDIDSQPNPVLQNKHSNLQLSGLVVGLKYFF